MKLTTNKKGFTLIEIVIVLAIAALILAGILIAVSGAQKSRRDTQRKDDASKIASYVEQYASNHNGDYPNDTTTLGTFNSTYLPASSNIKDPSTGAVYIPTYSATSPTTAGNVVFTRGEDCGADGHTPTVNTSARVYALQIGLEQGGFSCISNK